MKEKTKTQQDQTKQHFFLLIAVPSLIGFLIAFISMANASRLDHIQRADTTQPTEQGWQLHDGPTVSF